MHKHSFNKKGFTLIEVLIVIAILGIVAEAGYTLINTNQHVFNTNYGQLQAREDWRTVLNTLTEDLQTSDGTDINDSSEPDLIYKVNSAKGVVKYYKVLSGTIGSRNVYNILRKTTGTQGNIFVESVNSNGFVIIQNPDNTYDIDINVINRYNPDKAFSFKVTRRFGSMGVIKPIQIVAAATDQTVTMKGPSFTTVSTTDNSWTITLTKGTLKSNISNSDISIAGLPSGLVANVSQGSNNSINIALSGTTANAISSIVTVNIVVKGSAVQEANAIVSTAISVNILPEQFRPEDYLYCVTNVTINNNVKLYGDILIGRGSSTVVLNNNDEIYGNVYVDANLNINNNAVLGNSSNRTNLTVRGSIIMDNNSTVNGNVVYSGTLTMNNNSAINGSKLQTNNLNFPSQVMPSIKPDNWYTANGYNFVADYNNLVVQSNKKYVLKQDCNFNNSLNAQNIVLVGYGNINFSNNFTGGGIIFAPNGTVTFNNGCDFNGLIVSKGVVLNNNCNLTYVRYPNSSIPALPY